MIFTLSHTFILILIPYSFGVITLNRNWISNSLPLAAATSIKKSKAEKFHFVLSISDGEMRIQQDKTFCELIRATDSVISWSIENADSLKKENERGLLFENTFLFIDGSKMFRYDLISLNFCRSSHISCF